MLIFSKSCALTRLILTENYFCGCRTNQRKIVSANLVLFSNLQKHIRAKYFVEKDYEVVLILEKAQSV